MNREVGLGSHSLSHSLINHTVSVDVKHRKRRRYCNSPKLRSCVNREVVLGSHSLSNSSPVPSKPYGFCGCKAPCKKRKKLCTELIITA